MKLILLLSLIPASILTASAPPPHATSNPASPVMLAGDWVPADPHTIDFDRIPRVAAQHIVVSDVSAQKGVNQHNYLVHHGGKFWAMWSDGPRVEDMGGQIVKYATSADGVNWSAPRPLTSYPPNTAPGSPNYNTRNKEGMRYIARGFWVRKGELLALASLDEAAGFFGPSLALRAFRWNSAADTWDDIGVVRQDGINNFPPERLPSGEWAMINRRHDYGRTGVDFLIGGERALDDWKSVPVVTGAGSGVSLRAEEPIWYVLPDRNLVALFRDNAKSGYIFRAFSTDNGRSWTRPVKTNFPDARSKLHAIRLRDGRYVLVSNANPKKRDPLTLAISDDGLVFNQLFYVVGGRHVDYPQVMEHEGYLYIAHSGGKMSVEIERLKIDDLKALKMPASVN